MDDNLSNLRNNKSKLQPYNWQEVWSDIQPQEIHEWQINQEQLSYVISHGEIQIKAAWDAVMYPNKTVNIFVSSGGTHL